MIQEPETVGLYRQDASFLTVNFMVDTHPNPAPTRTWSAFVVGSSILYAVLVGCVALHHETWRDEADSWLAARDLSFTGLFTFTRYVGMPALWLLILFPFAKTGFPYFTMQVLHWALATGGAVIFLARAPFPRVLRLLVVFSYPIAFEYALVARNYVLIVLLLWVIAALFPSRLKRPLTFAVPVFLLFNTAVHSLAFAGAVCVVYAVDVFRQGRRPMRNQWLALALMTAGALAVVVQLRPPADGQLTGAMPLNPLALEHVARQAFVQTLYVREVGALGPVLNVTVIALAFVTLLNRPRALFILVTGSAWLLYIFFVQVDGPGRASTSGRCIPAGAVCLVDRPSRT